MVNLNLYGQKTGAKLMLIIKKLLKPLELSLEARTDQKNLWKSNDKKILKFCGFF